MLHHTSKFGVMLNQETSGAVETADALVVGGGIIGLAVARALRLRGIRKVTLLERARPGLEASHAAAGMLAPQVEADRVDDFLALACRSRDLYPAFARELHEETGIDIELDQTGTLLLSFNEEDEEKARARRAWQTRAGLSVEQLTTEETLSLEPFVSRAVRGALRFPRDWQVENRLLASALAVACERLQVRLHADTNVESILTKSGRVVGVETERGVISAPVVIVACGAWSSLISGGDKLAPALSIEPVRGQMLCFAANPQRTRHVVYSPRGYIVPRRNGRLLAGSTLEHAGFDKRVTAEGRRAIQAQALEIAPGIASLPLLDAWAGLRPRAPDDLPVLGMSTETDGLFYATGHYRNGILLAPVTGEVLAEQVTGGAASGAQWSAFAPARFQLIGAH
jgi:glycine oxidase